MKRLFVIALLVLLPATMMAQVQHLKFTQNGEFASLSESTSPTASFTLNVSRNASTDGTTAHISFTSFDIAPDFSSLVLVNIFGAIPPGDFTGQNTENMALNFSTDDLDPSTSFSQTCSLNLVTFSFSCGPGPSGTISLQFSRTDAQRTQILALEQVQTAGPITFRVHQKSDDTSASAQGTVFGVIVVGGNATVGINHNSFVEAIRD